MPRFLGRRVAALQKRTTDVSYTYDANSTRATKTVNGVKYTYQYIGGKLVHETRGEKSFHYYYDANGYLTAIKYRLTPTGQDYAYYATHNWRGDVVGLYNGDGDLKAKYEYDTWGKVISVKDANGTRITDQNHVGNLNPFRYRGYYYDTETGLYYLMTRYYDPVTHRFLNADGYYQSGGGLLDTNMNAYCANSPVSNIDPDGTCWIPIYSPCGAQMGSKWVMMGSIPGVPYCCHKCGKNDPSYSSNTKKPQKVNEYIGTTSSNQDVYIMSDSINENSNDIYILDLRKSKDPYFEVKQSYLITQKEIQLEVIRMLQHYNARNPVNPEWKRTDESMSMEWDMHNYAYNQLDGILKERAADVSLNNADETLYYLMYKYDTFDMY